MCETTTKGCSSWLPSAPPWQAQPLGIRFHHKDEILNSGFFMFNHYEQCIKGGSIPEFIKIDLIVVLMNLDLFNS